MLTTSRSEGRIDRAERMAALAVKEDPDNANFIDTYAWVYFAQRIMKKPCSTSRAPSRMTRMSTCWKHYGDILWFNNERRNKPSNSGPGA